ncbi:MAG: tRNA preQ1(34) S-adenosylmethionine ribosyltransferase-isomerase QueA [Spirochaetes bacterium]|nr:tRNA preQ1(34) S-adenosylmethionine ribosyltransferase-isomerase QueA [Spirochaetota bacterium]
MKTEDFFFHLPKELIAQRPVNERGTSRLMVLDRKTAEIVHSNVNELARFIKPGSIIVLNNTRVRKARLFGRSINQNGTEGGRVEFILLERIEESIWKAITSKSRKQKTGKNYVFPDNLTGRIIGIKENEKIIQFNKKVNDGYLNKYGHMPLPPYIKRPDDSKDEERYQTVYSRYPGSSAAPTAGLHLTWEIMDELKRRDAEIMYIDLSVGLGTFLPIRKENIEDHRMHAEKYNIPAKTAVRINKALKEKRDIVAVGTTVVRALESSWDNGRIMPGIKETDIFIYPGYRFNVVNKLFTNFHTPESSLLLLVSAFAGKEVILDAYGEAVRRKYRFFSYGDAMLIL